MLNAIVRKVAVGVASAGLVIAPVATAASAATAAEPQATKYSYSKPGKPGKYHGKVVTRTHLKLAKSVGKKGQRNWAFIRVTSGAGKPSGRIILLVNGKVYGTAVVRNGVARLPFGKNLPAGKTYRVTAVFAGSGKFKDSSDTAYYTVVKKKGHKPRRR